MSGTGNSEREGGEAVTYCVVPRDLAAKLLDPLRRFYVDDPSVRVIAERRGDDRRRPRADRRALGAGSQDGERRRIRNAEGRRIADRRATAVTVDPRPLPRRARSSADRLVFVERLEPSTLQAEDLDSARLVTRIQAGDKTAFSELYMRYFDHIYGYLRLLLKNSHAAEDATQEVFIRLITALPSYERQRQPFRAWLFVVVRNHAISTLRQEGRVDLVESDELDRHRERHGVNGEADDPDLRGLDWITDRELMLFVERLPLAQRQVLVLRYMLDLSHAQIAVVLERTPEDIRKLHSRAVRFLRGRLQAVGRGPAERPSRLRSLRRVGDARVARARRWSLVR